MNSIFNSIYFRITKNLSCLFFILINISVSAQQSTISIFEINGAKKTKLSSIKKISFLREGNILDSIKIEKDVDRLKRLPSIANATYQVEQIADGTFKLTYNLEENFTIIPAFSVWSSDNGDLAYRTGLFEFNALGRNMVIGGFYQKDIFNSYGGRFSAPYAFGPRWGFALNYMNLNTEEPVFFDTTTAIYKYQNISYEITGLYQMGFRSILDFGFNYFEEEYNFLRGTTDEGFPTKLEADKYAYKARYSYNDISFDFYKVSGWRNILNAQYVRGVSTTLPSFFIAWNDISYFKRIGTHGNWGSRLHLGFATNDDTPFAPFAADNNLNIRGAGNTIDRGTAAFIVNTEYRHTLFEKGWFVLQGNAFIDAGTWRDPGGKLSDFTETDNMRVYPGVGLRFIHKRIFNAIFRIDYGYGLVQRDKTRTEETLNGIVFGIGQYF